MAKYTPIYPQFFDDVFLDSYELIDKNGSLEIRLTDDETKVVKITFDFYLCYRVSDETERYVTLGDMGEEITISQFLQVQESEYLNWLMHENLGYNRNIEELLQYTYLTERYIIEVIATKEPIITEVLI